MINYVTKFNGIYKLGERVKKIDKTYMLAFNRHSHEFELYSCRGLFPQKELSLGRKLDLQVITKIRQTRVENITNTIKNIDKFNEKLEENAFFEILDKTRLATKEVITYADKCSRDLSENEIQEIING